MPGGTYISPNIAVSGIESADYALSGSVACAALNSSFSPSQVAGMYPSMAGADAFLCLKPGPGYIERCP